MAIPGFIYRSFSRLFPRAAVETKSGTRRSMTSLDALPGKNGSIQYKNNLVCLTITERENGENTVYDLKLENLQEKSLRITRLRFPAWRGLEDILTGFDPDKVSFLRNGYQSWSTTRSYRMREKPLRPRLRLVSMVTSNMANLPSNAKGMLSSEMYTIVSELEDGQAVLVGQLPPYNQFVYILLNIHPKVKDRSYFEIIYDFGRKVLDAGESLELSSLFFTSGPSHRLEERYFSFAARKSSYRQPEKNLLGWCSWYQYYEHINPGIIKTNLELCSRSSIPFDFFQIDDGWQAATGDWLTESLNFRGKIKSLAQAITEKGMMPGIWLAPFSAARNSQIYIEHPEYILRDENGRAIRAGYNPTWNGFYYGLDISHPRFREYIQEVILNITQNWGYKYLKLDFLFSACLRGANHHNIKLSRVEVLREGMELIRKAAPRGTRLLGCGMPLAGGIGTVDYMRIGPDTGDYWLRLEGKLLRTGSMMGLRNAMRSTMMRSGMNRQLWVNDPDCILARATGTRLSPSERQAQLDALAVSGGLMVLSDEMSLLTESDYNDLKLLLEVNRECYGHNSIALDGMEREVPELFWNDAMWLAVFNWGPATRQKVFTSRALLERCSEAESFQDIRSGEVFSIRDGRLDLGPMPRRSSRLLRARTAFSGS